jgi:hypothetical protein
MIQATQPTVKILPEVSAFAAEEGVSKELPLVVEMTQRVYPGVPLNVIVEDDPEIANDRHIVIEADPINLTVDKALQARNRWVDGLFACCPAPKVCVFRISVGGVR